jgi:hypothetical protein
VPDGGWRAQEQCVPRRGGDSPLAQRLTAPGLDREDGVLRLRQPALLAKGAEADSPRGLTRKSWPIGRTASDQLGTAPGGLGLDVDPY